MRERWALSRRELRDEGRRGVVGRERGERERRRWEREEGGSWVGVVDAIAARWWGWRVGWGGGGRCWVGRVVLRVDGFLAY